MGGFFDAKNSIEIIIEFNQKSVLKSWNTKYGSNRFVV